MSPKNGMQGMVVGAITLRLFAALPEAQAGWLVKAWMVYRKEMKEPEEIPPEVFGAWIAVKEEANAMFNLSQARAEAGRKGGKAQANSSKLKQTQASSSKTEQTQAEKEEEREEEKEYMALPSGSANTRTPARKIPQRLAEAMADAPLSADEALGKAEHCGLSVERLVEWAEWFAQRGWAMDYSGNLHAINKKQALASIPRWRTRQQEFDAIKRMKDGQDGQGNIRGVRIAGSGNIKKKLEI